MQCIVSEQGQAHILSLTGRLDAFSAASFSEACRSLLALEPHRIIIDCAGLETLSSAGLRSILILVKACRHASIRLSFCSMQPDTEEIFSVTGFSTLCATYATREDALAAMA